MNPPVEVKFFRPRLYKLVSEDPTHYKLLNSDGIVFRLPKQPDNANSAITPIGQYDEIVKTSKTKLAHHIQVTDLIYIKFVKANQETREMYAMVTDMTPGCPLGLLDLEKMEKRNAVYDRIKMMIVRGKCYII